jgi:OmpA-OmpF porin, OOP family
MFKLKVLGALAAAAMLVGCTSDIEQIRNTTEGTGSAFTQALTQEYRDFALFEADEMYDWPDAGYFARKGLAAANGEVVLPEELGNWDLPADKTDEMSAAREKLIGLLDAGGRDRAPEIAARAQAKFDCWVEQQEENHQPDHIAACRDDFFAALAELEQAMGPAPQPAMPAPAMPETFLVYFDWDRADINADAQAVLDEVLAAVAAGTPISVTGHADRSGPDDYNMSLSLRRADAVREALISGGVAADAITVSGRGEEEPAVPTADGVREEANRRVEIILQ